MAGASALLLVSCIIAQTRLISALPIPHHVSSPQSHLTLQNMWIATGNVCTDKF